MTTARPGTGTGVHRVSVRRSALFALLLAVAGRVLLGAWGIVVPTLRPVAEPPDAVGSGYLGAPRFEEGAAGLLLGPWQRFDTQHYIRIAREGYHETGDSHYPPLYPLLIRMSAEPLGGGPVARMSAALFIATLATFGAFLLFHRLALRELGADGARNALLLFAVFPTAFFLFAGYSEPLFILLALASFFAARERRFVTAGALGALASQTRLTGWVLAAPIAWEALVMWREARRKGADGPRGGFEILARGFVGAALPLVGTAGFLLYRRWVGYAPLGATLGEIWTRAPGIPGTDLVTALHTLVAGGAARADQIPLLWVDFSCAVGALIAVPFVFRRLGVSHGLYTAGILFFILLATSSVIPLYSVARYVLPLFPVFFLIGLTMTRKRLAFRGVLVVSFALWLVFSAMFFARDWVG